MKGPLSKEVSIRENLKVYELEYSNTKIRGDIKVVKFGENNERLKEAYRVTGYDIQSTAGVEYVTVDPVYLRDETPTPKFEDKCPPF